MKKITAIDQLQESIILLETKQANEGALLKDQFKVTYESLKPISLIKSTLNELTSLPDFKGNLLETSLSLIAGFLSKKVVIGSSNNPFKQILGSLIQMGVTNIVSKNTNDIESFASRLFKKILNK